MTLPADKRGRTFVTTAQAAEILGVTQRTIQWWIQIGSIRAVRVGRNYRVYFPSVEAYLADCAGQNL
jgi:excisionase family DNA binding protein